MSEAPVLDEVVRDLMRQTTIIRMATITPRGRPHLAPYWFWSDGERIVISTLYNQTVRNLEANPDCAILVDLGTDFKDLRGAHIRGRARIHRRDERLPDQVASALLEIDRVHADEMVEPEFDHYQAWERRDGIALEIIPESATWFDLGRATMGRTGPSAGPLDPQPR